MNSQLARLSSRYLEEIFRDERFKKKFERVKEYAPTGEYKDALARFESQLLISTFVMFADIHYTSQDKDELFLNIYLLQGNIELGSIDIYLDWDDIIDDTATILQSIGELFLLAEK